MDSTLRELEHRFAALDWTVYPRLVRMRAACAERVPCPNVRKNVQRVLAVRVQRLGGTLRIDLGVLGAAIRDGHASTYLRALEVIPGMAPIAHALSLLGKGKTL